VAVALGPHFEGAASADTVVSGVTFQSRWFDMQWCLICFSRLTHVGTWIDPDLLLWNAGIPQKILLFVTGKIQDSGKKSHPPKGG
jgi:hypothetical protein